MSDATTPPKIPEIIDEAGNTPAWFPVVGLLLAAFLALVLVVNQATQDQDDEKEQDQAAEEQ